MKVGLIGLPAVGKSTLLRLLTGVSPAGLGSRRTAVAVARVTDPRVDTLTRLYQPKKTTYATLTVTEVPGLVPTRASAGGGPGGLDPKGFVDALRDVDALVYVVRAFTDARVPHLLGAVDPGQELALLAEELLLVDWELAQVRLERLKAAKKRQAGHEEQVRVLEKAAAALEAGTPLYTLGLAAEERRSLQGLTFFTDKPALVAVNLDEGQLASGAYPGRATLEARAGSLGAPVIECAGVAEAEIGELDPEERAAFLEDLGLAETGVERLARAAYERLGFISFFTVGEDEVRAWTIPRGADARTAAGAIHSDIARGFIRAEVARYEDLVAAGGWNALKAGGRLRLEGKDYVLADGDVVSFRFNV